MYICSHSKGGKRGRPRLTSSLVVPEKRGNINANPNPTVERGGAQNQELSLAIDRAEVQNLNENDLSPDQGTSKQKIDIQSEVDYWSTAVICGVVGSTPPIEVIDGYVHRIWSTKAIDRVVMAQRGVFLVRFTNLQDKRDVLQRRVSFSDKNPL
ncbi:hypothetical protein Cgig2_019153 [Carnegiea gigantea]|uniref:DUF4283 domain-containing protein n=1 Tax=Carnegiea gigantea TaxID=171969 RepID=A0A9Q1GIJ3_9CARY|nr:hypothetical protein Cgig2_019153 [Carnegiea gigantea]